MHFPHASMGPHFNECGNGVEPTEGFGVSTLLQWGRTSMSAETTWAADGYGFDTWASMGPHFNECGNRRGGWGVWGQFDTLQWGRTSMSAETTRRTRLSRRALMASMGPHFNECGNSFRRHLHLA